jgi:hypothetical protein
MQFLCYLILVVEVRTGGIGELGRKCKRNRERLSERERGRAWDKGQLEILGRVWDA